MRISGALIAAALTAALAAPAGAATITYLGDQAGFLAALGGASTQTQDFSGFAVGDDLRNVAVIPGISVDSNTSRLEAFSATDRVIFALGRGGLGGAAASYTVDVTGYNAVGFDLVAYDPAAGDGSIDITLSDGSVVSLVVDADGILGRVENDPIFFGVISDLAIDAILFTEGPEVDPAAGSEEVSLDNFIVASVTAVPEPSTLGLLAVGLLALGRWRAKTPAA